MMPTSIDSSTSASATWVLLISRRFRCTAGKRWRNEKIAWGMVELNGADEVKPIFSSPNSPSCARRATSAALSTCASTSRASSRNSRPASLSSTRRLVRSNKPRADFLLQRLDLLAQRRLRDAQHLCGAAEVQFFGDGDEVAQMTQFHENPIRS